MGKLWSVTFGLLMIMIGILVKIRQYLDGTTRITCVSSPTVLRCVSSLERVSCGSCRLGLVSLTSSDFHGLPLWTVSRFRPRSSLRSERAPSGDLLAAGLPRRHQDDHHHHQWWVAGSDGTDVVIHLQPPRMETPVPVKMISQDVKYLNPQ